MNGNETARLVYLVLLLTAVLGTYLVNNRHRMGRVAQQASIWALIFIGVVAAVGLWDDITRKVAPRETVMGDGRIEVPVAPDGHYYLSAEVNGKRLRFVVDTGASDIVLTADDAQRIGFEPAALVYSGRAQTANGMVVTAPLILKQVDLGGFRDQGVPAVVNAGDLDTSLLGMSYLSRYSITMAGDTMTLSR